MSLKCLQFVTLWGVGLSVVCNTKYSVKDFCHENYGSVIDVITNVTSFASCAALCCKHAECASVMYDAHGQFCTTNSRVASNFTKGCGMKYAGFLQVRYHDIFIF